MTINKMNRVRVSLRQVSNHEFCISTVLHSAWYKINKVKQMWKWINDISILQCKYILLWNDASIRGNFGGSSYGYIYFHAECLNSSPLQVRGPLSKTGVILLHKATPHHKYTCKCRAKEQLPSQRKIMSLGNSVPKQRKLTKGLKSHRMAITWQRKVADGIGGHVP